MTLLLSICLWFHIKNYNKFLKSNSRNLCKIINMNCFISAADNCLADLKNDKLCYQCDFPTINFYVFKLISFPGANRLYYHTIPFHWVYWKRNNSFVLSNWQILDITFKQRVLYQIIRGWNPVCASGFWNVGAVAIKNN